MPLRVSDQEKSRVSGRPKVVSFVYYVLYLQALHRLRCHGLCYSAGTTYIVWYYR